VLYVRQITTGQLVHRPATASLGSIDGALWLEIENAVGQHVNLCLVERRPIEVDGVSFMVREMRARPGEQTAAFRLVRL
jgi:hypothetical protein